MYGLVRELRQFSQISNTLCMDHQEPIFINSKQPGVRFGRGQNTFPGAGSWPGIIGRYRLTLVNGDPGAGKNASPGAGNS